jgi:metal-responsive CopG/Arc/MetJ family transcriptional regulator
MENTITLPNELFQRAEVTARQLGISLDELCSQALSRFLKSREERDESEITRKLNEIYEHEDSSPDPVLTQLQFATLEREDW